MKKLLVIQIKTEQRETLSKEFSQNKDKAPALLKQASFHFYHFALEKS